MKRDDLVVIHLGERPVVSADGEVRRRFQADDLIGQGAQPCQRFGRCHGNGKNDAGSWRRARACSAAIRLAPVAIPSSTTMAVLLRRRDWWPAFQIQAAPLDLGKVGLGHLGTSASSKP
ncbi:hypothetical protein [Zhengella sp.]|uniref:hypothetical protein n=1 Tax=Zhengella sp. TaxID=2282762 RepID=UPI003528CFB4